MSSWRVFSAVLFCCLCIAFAPDVWAVGPACPGPPPPYCPGPVKDRPLKRVVNRLEDAFDLLAVTVADVFYLGAPPLPNLSRAFSGAGVGISTAVETSIDSKRALAQAQTDSWAVLHNASIAAEAAMKRVGTPERGNVLCHTIALRQLVPVMDQFAEIVSRTVMSGFLIAGRGPGQDYGGPAYINLDRSMTCGTINPGDPVTGHPADGNSPACTAQEVDVLSPGETKPINPENNPTGSLFRDAGISVATLDPKQTVLTMPEMKDGTITLQNGSTMPVRYPAARILPNGKPDPKQQMWIAARDYCTRVGGPHPTPPWGNALLTDKNVNSSRCLSMKLSFMKTCADRIGSMTRPDCANPIFNDLCQKTKDVCTIARAHNIVLAPKFQECKYGLSAYEVEEVSSLLCDGSGRYINVRAQGDQAKDMSKMAEICAYSKSTTRRKRMLEDESFRASLDGLNNIRSCWEGLR